MRSNDGLNKLPLELVLLIFALYFDPLPHLGYEYTVRARTPTPAIHMMLA